jgi:hypothetical protein
MSDALAIAAVTAVLQYHLRNLYQGLGASVFGSTVDVTAQAPDIVQANITAGGVQVQNQVNIFLHQVTHNAAWRNVGLPFLASDGKTRLTNPPLALDLHYLLTAYGFHDWQAEALLGYALVFLHDYPVIARSDIAKALSSLTNPLTNLGTAVGASGLADQIEMIKITPATLGREEMAWLWTALKADYRPTFPFQASVVLMQQPRPIPIAFPVMRVDIQTLLIAPAQITGVLPPKGQVAPIPGNNVTVQGIFLTGASQVQFVNQRLGVSRTVDLDPQNVSDTEIKFAVPNDPPNFPAGAYNMTARFLDSANNLQSTTNSIPFAVAPTFNPATVTAVANAKGTLVTVICNPDARVRQEIYFSVADLASAKPTPTIAPALPFTANTNTLNFQFSPALGGGPKWLAILQVDDVTSPLQWKATPPPPAFTGPMVTI